MSNMQGIAFHENQTQTMSFAIDQRMKNIETMIPGIIVAVHDPEKPKDEPEPRTVHVKPAINRLLTNGESRERPTLKNVPVVFPGGGGYEITWDLKPDDLVIIIYSHRGLSRFIKNLNKEDPTSDPDVSLAVNNSPVVLPFTFKEQENKIIEVKDDAINISGESLNINGESLNITTGKPEVLKDEDGKTVNNKGEEVSGDDIVNVVPSSIRLSDDKIILSLGNVDTKTGLGDAYISIDEDEIKIVHPKRIFTSPVPSSTL